MAAMFVDGLGQNEQSLEQAILVSDWSISKNLLL
jgi:hypothetical protein